jgi:hypothetical protein
MAAVQIALAGFRERYPACRAVQQSRTQMRFEFGDRTGHIACRRIELLRGGREAARFRDFDENLHVTERVHTRDSIDRLSLRLLSRS